MGFFFNFVNFFLVSSWLLFYSFSLHKLVCHEFFFRYCIFFIQTNLITYFFTFHWHFFDLGFCVIVKYIIHRTTTTKIWLIKNWENCHIFFSFVLSNNNDDNVINNINSAEYNKMSKIYFPQKQNKTKKYWHETMKWIKMKFTENCNLSSSSSSFVSSFAYD